METELDELRPKEFESSMQSTAKHLIGKKNMLKGALDKFTIDQKTLDRKVRDTQSEFNDVERNLNQIKLLFSKKPPIDKPIQKIKEVSNEIPSTLSPELQEKLKEWCSGDTTHVHVTQQEAKELREAACIRATENGDVLDPPEEIIKLGMYTDARNRYVTMDEEEPNLEKVEEVKQRYADLLNTAQGAIDKDWQLSSRQINFMLLMLLKHVVEEKLNES